MYPLVIYISLTQHKSLYCEDAQVVKRSVKVTINSPSKDYSHADDVVASSFDDCCVQTICRFVCNACFSVDLSFV